MRLNTLSGRSSRQLITVGVLTVALFTSAACGSSSRGSSAGSTSSTNSGTSDAASSAAVDSAARALLPQSIRDAGAITVASTLTLPPEEFLDTDGTTPIGMSIDLGHALGAKLGISFNFVNVPFNAVLAGVAAGRYQAVIDSMSITPARRAELGFVSYFKSGSTIAVVAGNPKHITSMDGLCGADVAGIVGSQNAEQLKQYTEQHCLPQGLKAINIVWFPDSNSSRQALAAGRIDAQYGAYSSLSYSAAHSDGKIEITGGNITTGDMYGIGVQKSAPDLGNAIAAALNDLIQDGQYATIFKKWGLDEAEVDHADFLPPTSG